MSYETNPILNRITIRKGWKNPHFPFKTLNYSHEIILWFKLYLFLKNYLFLQKIMVLTCEIRLSENHKKILYLSVTKQFQKKKLPKSKWKSKSLLRDSKSLLTKIYNKKARFLLYQDLKTLKKNSFFFFNQIQKKTLLKAWATKPRFSSWINFSNSVYRIRQKTKKNLYQAHQKKNFFSFKKNANLIVNKSLFKNLKEKELFSKQLFWQRKQKKLLSLLSKTKKELFFIENNLNLIANWQTNHKRENFPTIKIQQTLFNNLFTSLTFKYTNQKILLEKIQQLYLYLNKINFSFFKKNGNLVTKKPLPNSWKTKKIKEKKRKIYLNFFWRALKKQLLEIHIKQLAASNRKRVLFLGKSNFFKRTQKYHILNATQFLFFSAGFNFSINKIQLLLTKKNSLQKNNKKMQIYKIILKNIWKHNFQLLNTLPKTQFLQKKTKILAWHLMRILRFKQKSKLNLIKKKNKFTRQTTSRALIKKKKNADYVTHKYRLPFTLLYKNHLTVWTGFRLTSLLHNLLKKYFGLNLTIKISWPLIQFKNLKFYRLLFPNYRPKTAENNSQHNFIYTKLNEKKKSKHNRYLYVGQMTNHLQLRKTIAQLQQRYRLVKKLHIPVKVFKRQSTKTILYKLNLKKRKNIKYNLKKKKRQRHILLAKIQKKPLKKNLYLISKSKILQKKSQKRLFWSAKTPDISNFLTTLTLFSKYLNPQPLVNHLAKLIGQTKNHSSVIKFVEKILHTVQMKRGVGYRIALIGRIDGANKSRTIYLRKLNRSRANQTFSKNVNFAMAQARATIGVFSIKIWIYS